jgi:hypothetical protein
MYKMLLYAIVPGACLQEFLQSAQKSILLFNASNRRYITAVIPRRSLNGSEAKIFRSFNTLLVSFNFEMVFICRPFIFYQ